LRRGATRMSRSSLLSTRRRHRPSPTPSSHRQTGLLHRPSVPAPAGANRREDADALAAALLDVLLFCST
jgi:hypothetical protein